MLGVFWLIPGLNSSFSYKLMFELKKKNYYTLLVFFALVFLHKKEDKIKLL